MPYTIKCLPENNYISFTLAHFLCDKEMSQLFEDMSHQLNCLSPSFRVILNLKQSEITPNKQRILTHLHYLLPIQTPIAIVSDSCHCPSLYNSLFILSRFDSIKIFIRESIALLWIKQTQELKISKHIPPIEISIQR